MAEPRVLIVDDEPEFLESMGERLRNRDFLVDTAGSGEVALEKIQANIYDAIVLDLMMPGIDGMATLKQALAKKTDLQIILLTGHATLETGVEAIKLGALDFMEKPADLELLAAKIREGHTRRLELDAATREEAVREALKKYGW
ncbi:MAG: response regulator [Desulfarculaceae bacterium]|nr:response regulator [Desulfarculaceae bacterium]MCF8072847.1 response regulator [Desulfarculaceae bacterium]MCF8101015.1 response regulator [Desulfarculaceae bacterium]MCF8115598.1 response regulator [Desulfarculaceae bacterium]